MPIRFSTEAANADVLGEDSESSAAPQAMPRAVGADRTPRDRFERSSRPGAKSGEADPDKAKSGKDINAAGFVKDKDSPEP
jgi:hypothetical protein